MTELETKLLEEVEKIRKGQANLTELLLQHTEQQDELAELLQGLTNQQDALADSLKQLLNSSAEQ